MKNKFLFILLIVLAACSGGRQQLLDEIKEKEAIVTKSYEDVLDKSTADEKLCAVTKLLSENKFYRRKHISSKKAIPF